MEEIWKPVPGFDNYEISNCGALRKDGKTINPKPYSGYLKVSLRQDKKTLFTSLHVLVLTTFIGPRPGHCRKIHACHNDGDKLNNHLSNLRWDTAENNVLDKMKHDVVPDGERHWKHRLTEDQVVDIIRNHNGRNSSLFAKKYGVHVATVLDIHKGISWKKLYERELRAGNIKVRHWSYKKAS